MRIPMIAAVVAAFAALPAAAQDFPSKQPIRLVVGFATGGGADAIARAMNTRLGEILKQSVVVENRGGTTGGTLRGRRGGQVAGPATPSSSR